MTHVLDRQFVPDSLDVRRDGVDGDLDEIEWVVACGPTLGSESALQMLSTASLSESASWSSSSRQSLTSVSTASR
jgi:hypothetical protein